MGDSRVRLHRYFLAIRSCSCVFTTAEAGVCWIQSVQDSGISLATPYQEKNQLMLRDGDTVTLTQSVHDQCTLKVVATSARQGVAVEADSRPHGLPASHVTTFIEAN